MISTQQAVRNAEQAYEDYMSRWVDNLTDYDEETNLSYALRDHYQKKNNFLVWEMNLTTWVIASSTPTFFEGGALVDHMHQTFFPTVKIDDEYHLLVTVPHPCNSLDDADYIAESFDKALEWLPKWEKEQAAHQKYLAAKKEWEESKQALKRA